MAYPPTAFLGLGALGAPMAANLLAAGVPLVVHNRTREREAPLQAAGARVAASPAEAAVAAQVVMLCLSDGAAVEEVLFGAKGAAKALAQAALDANGGAAAPLVIDYSTIEPARSRRLAERLAKQGITWLDAPVTGGTEGARAGTLSVLVGGEAASLERAPHAHTHSAMEK